MERRVEQLSAEADVSVDTIRYYQSKGLLAPPRREGRIAWYGEEHLERLGRIRSLQRRGFTLATIARLLSGELDAADEALLGQLTGGVAAAIGDVAPGPGAALTLEELSEATGIPFALLKALEAEGLLIPARVAGQERYTDEDVAAARAGLRLLEWGIPLSALLDLSRAHNEATEATARQAVELFARHVRDPLRTGARPDALEGAVDGDPAVEGLLQAYAELLPAVTTLVGHHFTRTLVRVALDHVEREGSTEERAAVWDRIHADADPVPAAPGGRAAMTASDVAAPDDGTAPTSAGITLEAAARAREADLPTGAAKTELVRSMFDAIAPRYDLVNRAMTFGLDVRWRKQALRALGLPPGATVLDLACGTGDFCRLLADGGYRAFGMDLSWGMLAANRTGLPLAQANGAALPVADASVDGVTCGYALRNFTDLAGVFAEFGRIVRPGGRLSLLEVSEPDAGLLRLGDRIWFRRVVPVIGGLLSDRDAYRYLPRSTAYLPAPTELRTLLVEAGFSSVNRRALSGGLSQLITATRAGRP